METNFEEKREKLVEFLSEHVLTNVEIKKAFLKVNRENFIKNIFSKYAYVDHALPINCKQTISQPSTIALMLELLELKKTITVLEIGSGSGYVLALLSNIVGKKGKIYGVEFEKLLVNDSEKNIEKEKLKNIEIKKGDGAEGWEEKAPFDRIIISCACPFIPKTLFHQLKEKGKIIAPVGDEETQVLEIISKENGKPLKKSYANMLFAFVPLRGKHGFR